MRTIPRSTRLAIAILYIRKRDAYRRRLRMLSDHGDAHPQFLAADGEWVALHNGLVAVIRAAHDEIAGDVRHLPAKAWLKLVAARAAALTRDR